LADPSPNRAVMIVLAYLWLLALIPLLVEKQDAEVQWHARHGIVLLVAELLAFALYIVLTSIVSLASLGLGVFLVSLLVFAWIGILALHVVAIFKALNGTRMIIPRVSSFASRF
jgi:uncharacterized membrane protein